MKDKELVEGKGLKPEFVNPIKKYPDFQQEFKFLENRLFKLLAVPVKCLKGNVESFSGALVRYREVRSLGQEVL